MHQSHTFSCHHLHRCDKVVRLKLASQDSSFVPSQPARLTIWEHDWDSLGVPMRVLKDCVVRWASVIGRKFAHTRTAADPDLPCRGQCRSGPLPFYAA